MKEQEKKFLKEAFRFGIVSVVCKLLADSTHSEKEFKKALKKVIPELMESFRIIDEGIDREA